MGSLRTCKIAGQTIETVNAVISDSKSLQVRSLSFQNSPNVFFLPVNVAKKFPELKIFDASICAVKAIFGENFKDMSVLKELYLDDNEIFLIYSNTFEDLVSLRVLSLRKFASAIFDRVLFS